MTQGESKKGKVVEHWKEQAHNAAVAAGRHRLALCPVCVESIDAGPAPAPPSITSFKKL